MEHHSYVTNTSSAFQNTTPVGVITLPRTACLTTVPQCTPLDRSNHVLSPLCISTGFCGSYHELTYLRHLNSTKFSNQCADTNKSFDLELEGSDQGYVENEQYESGINFTSALTNVDKTNYIEKQNIFKPPRGVFRKPRLDLGGSPYPPPVDQSGLSQNEEVTNETPQGSSEAGDSTGDDVSTREGEFAEFVSKVGSVSSSSPDNWEGAGDQRQDEGMYYDEYRTRMSPRGSADGCSGFEVAIPKKEPRGTTLPGEEAATGAARPLPRPLSLFEPYSVTYDHGSSSSTEEECEGAVAGASFIDKSHVTKAKVLLQASTPQLGTPLSEHQDTPPTPDLDASPDLMMSPFPSFSPCEMEMSTSPDMVEAMERRRARMRGKSWSVTSDDHIANWGLSSSNPELAPQVISESSDTLVYGFKPEENLQDDGLESLTRNDMRRSVESEHSRDVSHDLLHDQSHGYQFDSSLTTSHQSLENIKNVDNVEKELDNISEPPLGENQYSEPRHSMIRSPVQGQSDPQTPDSDDHSRPLSSQKSVDPDTDTEYHSANDLSMADTEYLSANEMTAEEILAAKLEAVVPDIPEISASKYASSEDDTDMVLNAEDIGRDAKSEAEHYKQAAKRRRRRRPSKRASTDDVLSMPFSERPQAKNFMPIDKRRAISTENLAHAIKSPAYSHDSYMDYTNEIILARNSSERYKQLVEFYANINQHLERMDQEKVKTAKNDYMPSSQQLEKFYSILQYFSELEKRSKEGRLSDASRVELNWSVTNDRDLQRRHRDLNELYEYYSKLEKGIAQDDTVASKLERLRMQKFMNQAKELERRKYKLDELHEYYETISNRSTTPTPSVAFSRGSYNESRLQDFKDLDEQSDTSFGGSERLPHDFLKKGDRSRSGRSPTKRLHGDDNDVTPVGSPIRQSPAWDMFETPEMSASFDNRPLGLSSTFPRYKKNIGDGVIPTDEQFDQSTQCDQMLTLPVDKVPRYQDFEDSPNVEEFKKFSDEPQYEMKSADEPELVQIKIKSTAEPQSPRKFHILQSGSTSPIKKPVSHNIIESNERETVLAQYESESSVKARSPLGSPFRNRPIPEDIQSHFIRESEVPYYRKDFVDRPLSSVQKVTAKYEQNNGKIANRPLSPPGWLPSNGEVSPSEKMKRSMSIDVTSSSNQMNTGRGSIGTRAHIQELRNQFLFPEKDQNGGSTAVSSLQSPDVPPMSPLQSPNDSAPPKIQTRSMSTGGIGTGPMGENYAPLLGRLQRWDRADINDIKETEAEMEPESPRSPRVRAPPIGQVGKHRSDSYLGAVETLFPKKSDENSNVEKIGNEKYNPYAKTFFTPLSAGETIEEMSDAESKGGLSPGPIVIQTSAEKEDWVPGYDDSEEQCQLVHGVGKDVDVDNEVEVDGRKSNAGQRSKVKDMEELRKTLPIIHVRQPSEPLQDLSYLDMPSIRENAEDRDDHEEKTHLYLFRQNSAPASFDTSDVMAASSETLWSLGPGYDGQMSAPASMDHGMDQYSDQYSIDRYSHDRYPDDVTWDRPPSEADQSVYSQDFSTVSWDGSQNSAPSYKDVSTPYKEASPPYTEAPTQYVDASSTYMEPSAAYMKVTTGIRHDQNPRYSDEKRCPHNSYDNQSTSQFSRYPNFPHKNQSYEKHRPFNEQSDSYDGYNQKYDDYGEQTIWPDDQSQSEYSTSNYGDFSHQDPSSSYPSNTTWDNDIDFQGYPEWDIHGSSLANFDRRSFSDTQPYQYSTLSLPRNFQYKTSLPSLKQTSTMSNQPQGVEDRKPSYDTSATTEEPTLRYAFSSDHLYPDESTSQRTHARSARVDQYFGLMPDTHSSKSLGYLDGHDRERSFSVPPYHDYEDSINRHYESHNKMSKREGPPSYESLDISRRQGRPQSSGSGKPPYQNAKPPYSEAKPFELHETVTPSRANKPPQYGSQTLHARNRSKNKPRYANLSKSLDNLNQSGRLSYSQYSNQNGASPYMNRALSPDSSTVSMASYDSISSTGSQSKRTQTKVTVPQRIKHKSKGACSPQLVLITPFF